jgi:ribA/ribD-fused uncharacterized protein
MIKFYKVWDDYPNRIRAKWGEFGNFYRRNFYFDGYTWPSSEHCYQAMKYKYVGGEFFNQERFHLIRTAPTCREAKDWANDKSFPIRPDWDEARVEVMYQVCLAKFSEHEDLAQVLLSTGDEELVEDSPVDPFWGRGPNWDGENALGKVLMRVRDALQKRPKPEEPTQDNEVLSFSSLLNGSE